MAHMLIHVSVLVFSAMVFLLEDGIGFDSLELGLEITNGVAVGAAVGATTGVGEVVTIILGLVSRSAPTMLSVWMLLDDLRERSLPVAFASTLLLHLLGIGIDMA